MKDVTGWYPYKGTTTLQHEDIATHLKVLFKTIKPSQVLEIGTSYGGLTLLVRDLLDEKIVVSVSKQIENELILLNRLY